MYDHRDLIQRIQSLPPERIAEVEDFVEFITQKDRRLAALDRLLAVAPALATAGAKPITDTDILSDIEAMRAEHNLPD